MSSQARTILIISALLISIIAAMFIAITRYTGQNTAPDETSAASDTTQARVLFATGARLTGVSKYDSSLSFFEKAAAIYKKETMWEPYVDCMNYLGDNYRRLGKYDTSFTLLTATIDTAIHQLGEMHASTAMSINKLGLWYQDNGDYEKATEKFNQALSIRTKVLPNKHIDIGWSYNNLGVAQYNIGNFNEALQYYDKAIPIFLNNLGEKSGPLAIVYTNIASIYQAKGKQEKVLEYINRSLDIRLQLFGSDHITLAENYTILGTMYLREEDFDKAFKYYNQALSITANKLGEQHPNIGSSFYNLAFAYKEVNKYDYALYYFRKALIIWEQRLGAQHPLVARVCDEIGSQMLMQCKYDSALYYFNRALLIWTNKPGVKRFRRAYQYSHIGTTYLKKGNFQKAMRFYEQALSVNLEYYGKKHLEVSLSYSDMANAYMSIRDYSNALKYSQYAIGALLLDNKRVDEAQTLNAVQLILALDLKGDILNRIYERNTNNLETLMASFGAYELAIQWLDKVRREYSSDDSKLLIGQRANKIFEKAIDAALKLHVCLPDSAYLQKAFLYCEKSKAAVLTEVINDEHAKVIAGIPDSLLEYESQLRSKIGYYNKKLFAEQNDGGYGSKKFITIQDKLFELTTKYDRYLKNIEVSFPEFYLLKYKPMVISLEDVKKNLPDSTAMIEYYLGERNLFVFCIEKNRCRWVTSGLDSTFILYIRNMRRGMESQDFSSYSTSAYRLYELLIQPFIPLNARHLIVIPDGSIASIPFDALLSKPAKNQKDYSKLDYLINDFDISYAYSATLKFQNPLPQTNAFNNLIGFSPSIFK